MSAQPPITPQAPRQLMPEEIGGAIDNGDGTMTPLSHEEAAQYAQAQADAKVARDSKVHELMTSLCSKRDVIVRAMREIQKRWIDDQRQMDGESRLMNTKEFPSQNSDQNANPPVPHFTRARAQLWQSRMTDSIAPTNDPTWDLRALVDEDPGSATYDESMQTAMADFQKRQQAEMALQQQAPPPAPPQGPAQPGQPQQPGQPPQQAQPAPQQPAQPPAPPPQPDPPTQDDLMELLREDQQQRARKMKRVVQDQLGACNATEALRGMCDSAVNIGTGLLMGPMAKMRTARRWSQGKLNVVSEEVVQPEVRLGDPWFFYCDMVSCIDKAEFAFYLHLMSETELRAFMQFPEVDSDAVLKVIKEDIDIGEVGVNIKSRNNFSGYKEETANRYPVWRYTGIVDQKYRDILDVPEDYKNLICADIWFCNDTILKSKITPLSAAQDYRIPYYVFSPFRIDDTMFGASIPYLCRDSQRMATSALWILLANASVSSGPQILMRPGKIRPKDGKYTVRGPKLWDVLDDNVDMNNVFNAINIPNNVEQALGVFNLAKQMLDEELNTAQWASPDTSEETQTASGLAMLMNSRTILQRKVCAAADDQIFRPMIERFVLWNLLFSKREDIKGNFDVLPLCQSVRLVKDIQIQQKLFVASQLAQNPMFQGMFSTYDMLQDITRDLDVQVDNWLVPRDKWEKIQAQQAQNPQNQLQQQLAASQLMLNQAKAKTEEAKQGKLFNDSQNQEQQGQDNNALTADAQLKHQQFLISSQMQMQEGDRLLQQHTIDNQTKLQIAAMKTQEQKEKTGAALDSSVRKERTDLIKTGVQAKVGMHAAAIKASKPAGPSKTPAAPKFTAPKAPKYSGGKRPAS
jgi:hypothetical protein